MTAFAYTTVPGKIGSLLKKVQEVGVPPKATQEWLKSIGFGSSNDRSLLGALKQIGLIDTEGKPSKRWKDFRGRNGPVALADAIRTGYADLFATYPDANSRPDSDLDSFFKTHTDAGKQAIDKTVRTFKALCTAADFSVPAGGAPDDQAQGDIQGPTIQTVGATSGPVTVNINVQLVLPESTDQEVYSKFFSAMREHLLSPRPRS